MPTEEERKIQSQLDRRGLKFEVISNGYLLKSRFGKRAYLKRDDLMKALIESLDEIAVWMKGLKVELSNESE